MSEVDDQLRREQEQRARALRIEQLAENTREQRRTDFATWLATPGGRRLFWGLLVDAGLFASTSRGEETHATAEANGRRDFALALMLEAQALDGGKRWSELVTEQLRAHDEEVRYVAGGTNG